MKSKINTHYWKRKLNEEGMPAQGGDMGAMPGGPPGSPPGGPGDPMGQNPTPPPPQGGPKNPKGGPQQPEDMANDPQYPDMPEEDPVDQDFENWKIAYVKESIKGDPKALEQLILKIRDKKLDPNPRKFVEDNLQICFLRQHQDVLIPSKKIRELIKKQLDRNLPGTTLVTHITETLETTPLVNNIFIKLLGLGGGKQDLHRKFIASLVGGVQIGSGMDNEDVIFEETEYSIRISTRFNTKWGDVNLGSWSLKEGDPEKFLKPAELKRLDGGSPEEKDVLRRRVVMEAIADKFKERAFIVNSVSEDGTIQHLGFDISNCLRSAFIDGKLVVRTRGSDILQAFIDEDGSIVPVPDMSIYYVKEGDTMNDKGKPELEEIEFIAHKNGTLFLKAQGDLIKEASTSLQGLIFKEVPWEGNPSDMMRISRCVPSVPEQLLKDC